MNDSRNVEALGLVTHHAENGLKAHDDEDGETSLGVRVGEVRTSSLRCLDDDDDESDEGKHKGRNGKGTVIWEPLEEGPSVSTDEDGSRDEDEPSKDHKDHVYNDKFVAPVQDTVTVGERASSCWCHGAAPA